jgi:predicted transcriptional regulator
MHAKDKILNFLKDRRSDGVMQSEVCSALKLSKSTVSEILKELEAEEEVVKRKIGKSCRVWHADFAPFPVKRMRIGILKAAEYPHVILAAEKLNARIVVFDNALDLTRALTTGSIDAGCSPLITQVMFGLLLKSIKIHAVVAYNGSGIVSKKEIRDAKSFATTELSAMESNLRLFIDELGIHVERIRYFNSVDNMIKNFMECEIDAVAIWEPYFSSLEGIHYEFRQILGEFPCCSLASNVSFYSTRKKELTSLMEEMKMCLKEMNEEEIVRAHSSFGFKRDEILKCLNSYRFSAEIGRKDIEFLERYGFKLIGDNIECIFNPLTQ